MTTLKLTTPMPLIVAALLVACGGGGPATKIPALPPASTPSGTASPSLKPSSTSPSAVPIGPVATAAILSLGFASGEVAPGREFQLEVRLDPKGHGISGAQFELHFLPNQVAVLGIRPGTLLGPDPLEINKIGDKPGVLVYAAARRGVAALPTPARRFASVELWVLDDVAVGAAIQVWLQAAQVADENIQRVTEVDTRPPVQLLAVAPG